MTSLGVVVFCSCLKQFLEKLSSQIERFDYQTITFDFSFITTQVVYL